MDQRADGEAPSILHCTSQKANHMTYQHIFSDNFVNTNDHHDHFCVYYITVIKLQMLRFHRIPTATQSP